MCVGNEMKPELDELLGPDAQRVSYVEDARMHSGFRWIQAGTPLWLGFNPLPAYHRASANLRRR
jgi:hypothetical protein